jgi:integrase
MVRKVLRTLKHILNWALEGELIQAIPAFPSIKSSETKHTWIDEETQDRVFAEIPECDRGIFLFLRHQGCRICEAIALHWEDIDLKNEIATIRRSMAEYPRRLRPPKTDHENLIPLHPEVLEWLKANRAPRQFVFIGRKGKPYQFTHLRRVWHRACQKAELKGVTLNQGVRHSFGSRKVSQGHDLYCVGQLMGHRSVETTKRYARHDLESKRRVIAGVVEFDRKPARNLHKQIGGTREALPDKA